MTFLIAANFGGVMGCAIGMSVAAACEIIYWLTLKPVVKLIASCNIPLSTRAKYIYKKTRDLIISKLPEGSYIQHHRITQVCTVLS